MANKDIIKNISFDYSYIVAPTAQDSAINYYSWI